MYQVDKNNWEMCVFPSFLLFALPPPDELLPVEDVHLCLVALPQVQVELPEVEAPAASTLGGRGLVDVLGFRTKDVQINVRKKASFLYVKLPGLALS